MYNLDKIICNSDRSMSYHTYKNMENTLTFSWSTNVEFTSWLNVGSISCSSCYWYIYCVLSGRSWSYWSPWSRRSTGTPRRGWYPRISRTRRSIGLSSLILIIQKLIYSHTTILTLCLLFSCSWHTVMRCLRRVTPELMVSLELKDPL